jgi:hypothetical protein
MKRLHLAIVIAFVVALAIPLTASAQGGAIESYDSGFQIQNLHASDDASVEITFYEQDGDVAATVSDTIAAADSNTYFPLSALTDGFFGSVAVSSNREVRGIVNVLGDGLDFGASYGAFVEGAETVYVPLGMKLNSGFSTWFNVQNTGDAATDVSVVYSDGVTASCTGLVPHAACTFDQSTEAHAAGWVGSAVVTAGEPVAVSVMEEGPTTLFGYTGFPDGLAGSPEVAMPLINANNSGFVSGVQIMNLGATETEVTVTYTPSTAGTACSETQTIPAEDSVTFALDAFTASGVCGASTFIGSAEVTANSAGNDLVAIVNQLNSAMNKGAAYEAFDPENATDSVVMPLIMDRNNGYWTGFSVANVGSSAATVECTFTDTTFTASETIAAGEAMTHLQLGEIADGYVGSGTCTAAGGEIVGIVNELNGMLTGDAFLVYAAFNK